MASSNWEEASASLVAVNAPPVTMEAKMLVATGHEHCQQLKDVLSKEDPSMLVVVMASGNQTSTPKPRLPVMDPRLLAAACSGSFQDLEALLSGEDRRASSAGRSAKQPASDDEESFLRESLLDMVTIGGDTALHVVATHDDSDDFLKKARIIHGMAKTLLFVQNNMGDTPVHCAARAGRSQMVSLLIDLAKCQDENNASKVKALLETENMNNGTALHEAVRGGNIDIVKLLMLQDQELASFPKDGVSPLYLAILLGNGIIAKTLYKLSSGLLSYSGPNGQNALHAAVLRGECCRPHARRLSAAAAVGKAACTRVLAAARRKRDPARPFGRRRDSAFRKGSALLLATAARPRHPVGCRLRCAACRRSCNGCPAPAVPCYC